MKKGLKRLPPGVSVMCFAEGTRSPDGNLQPFLLSQAGRELDYVFFFLLPEETLQGEDSRGLDRFFP